METIKINFNNNPEEYREFIRVIRNVKIFYDILQFYDSQPDLGYEFCEEKPSSSCTTQAAPDL